ncbi:hypothetical protein B296_00039200 [Ensete ventricosum]|uniref:Bidirectional sugar transporter SWEET n=1 Tax=Ensete ventricosum TaxID=4639 RepID=A0A426XN77_ENSVE|nr:hypothetical protein B296_00039200 [Ensete ventricosum]
MLWILYAFLKTDAFLLTTINSFGCVIESVYVVLYLTYAPKLAKCMKPTAVEPKLPEHIISISMLGVEIYPIDWKTPEVNDEEKAETGDRKEADSGDEKVAAPHEENEVNHVDV